MLAANATLATATAMLAGVLIWLGLFWWQRKQPITLRSLFLTFLTAGILCRLAFIFFTPVFHAPDEQSHFNYIKHLSEQKTFPIQTTRMGDAANEWEYFQPPLYYLILVPLYRAAEWMFHDQTATVVTLRCCSLLLWLMNVWFGVVWLRRLQIKDRPVWMLVMALACLLPTYTFVSSAINNDNLLATLGGGLLCLMARRGPSSRTSLALGGLLGLALLTKQSALVFIPALVLLTFLDCRRSRLLWSAGFRHLTLVLGVAALLFAPWALRNFQVYGTFTPEHLSATPVLWPSFLHGFASAGHNLVKTFWAVSGISNNVGYPFPLVGLVLLVAWVVGQQMGLTREQKTDALNLKANGPVVAALALAVFLAVVLVLQFGYLFGMGQGRHLFLLLYPILLFLAAGWRFLPVKHLEVHAAGICITYAVSFVVFSLCRFP